MGIIVFLKRTATLISYSDIRGFLAGNVPYYQKLPVAEQKRFADRVSLFMNSKSIEGRQGLEVTPDMRMLLAATAVQLTFGLETWDMSYFNYIMLFPADYMNPSTRNYHKGETNMGGFMCFSWKHFMEGLAVPNDKINLGLHEFAHALRFNGIRGHETDHFFTSYFDRWLACALEQYQRIRDNHPSIFRKYGGVNVNEFFSVAVETFFETPAEFKAFSPELFDQTAILLNQYIGPDGRIVLNVRQELLPKKKIALSKDYPDVLSHTLRGNGLVIFSTLFFIVGLISLQGEGYKYPPAYICFAVAGLCWLILERLYTRVLFEMTGFEIQKGYMLFRNYARIKLPYAALVSLRGTGNGDVPAIYVLELTYLGADGNFHEIQTRAHIHESAFEQLSSDLRRNYIPVIVN